MKRFLMRYTRDPATGPAEDWDREVQAFIEALDADPELGGRIVCRCLKVRDGDAYLHLAEPADDEAAKLLADRDFFRRYAEGIKRVAAGRVEVLPLVTIAETRPR